MARKLSLPLFNLDGGLARPAPRSQKPTVDEVRKRLGGRASTGPGAGELVTLTTPGGDELPGVVLFSSADDIDIWVEQPGAAVAAALGAGVVRRARRADVTPLRAPSSKDLDAVAADARVFGALREGQRIHYAVDGGLSEGTLVEKCRYGALVERDDGSLLGVGFRRLWPTRPDGDRN
ncbi:MAG TPA: hypothetical protein VLS89_07360 [Candidatus Nanopelagicales bacterium]|nr:hypothetical protein [Candidatus Nanopelagicales bacterium]